MWVQGIVHSPRAEQCSAVLKTVGRMADSDHAELGPGASDELEDCWIHMLEYNPARWSNSSWVPCSITIPSLKTRIKSNVVRRISNHPNHVQKHRTYQLPPLF